MPILVQCGWFHVRIETGDFSHRVSSFFHTKRVVLVLTGLGAKTEVKGLREETTQASGPVGLGSLEERALVTSDMWRASSPHRQRFSPLG